jgi:hypothetical protein
MTLLVRDEADVVDANLRYHLNQGVDFVVATDNGSVDGTVEVLREYERRGHLHLISEPGEGVWYRQASWVTRMARLAATEFGAEWVINNDADEFWWPLEGNLKDALGGISSRHDLVVAPRPEFVLRPGDGWFADRLIVREAISRTEPKVAHRARPDLIVSNGGHSVVPGGGARPSGPFPRRALHGASPWSPQPARPFVAAPQTPIQILHFPARSYAQLARKVEEARRPGGASEGLRIRGAVGPEQFRPDAIYARVLADDARAQAGLGTGALVVDTRLRDFLAACPDPLAADWRPPDSTDGAVGRPAGDEEMAAVQDDVALALARREQRRTLVEMRLNLLSERLRGRLEQRSEHRLARAVTKLERSHGWRLRMVIMRLNGRLRRLSR